MPDGKLFGVNARPLIAVKPLYVCVGVAAAKVSVNGVTDKLPEV